MGLNKDENWMGRMSSREGLAVWHDLGKGGVVVRREDKGERNPCDGHGRIGSRGYEEAAEGL